MNRQQAGNERRAKEARERWQKRKAEILWLYHDNEWSQAKIAGYFGVSQSAIWKIMKMLGIVARCTGNPGKRNGRYVDGSQSTMYRLMIEKDKCSSCGSKTNLVIHHKNGDHTDNRLENLKILCSSCHTSFHKKLWWEKQRSIKAMRD